MLAYKFLARGAIGPFTGFAWPVPAPPAPGAWVIAEGDDQSRWIHASRVEDLPHWIDAELYRIELDDPVASLPMLLASPRARLIERIEGWTDAAAQALGEAGTLRIRGFAVERCTAAGLSVEAEALRASAGLDDLREAARAVCARKDAPAAVRRVAEYVGDAVHFLRQGHVACVLYIAARAAVAYKGEEDAQRDERRWQARWLADRLGLSAS